MSTKEQIRIASKKSNKPMTSSPVKSKEANTTKQSKSGHHGIKPNMRKMLHNLLIKMELISMAKNLINSDTPNQKSKSISIRSMRNFSVKNQKRNFRRSGSMNNLSLRL